MAVRSLWGVAALLCVAFLIAFADASVLPRHSLFARQNPEEFDYALCQPQCEQGSCGTGGWCPVFGFSGGTGLVRRSVDEFEEPYKTSLSNVEARNLSRRLFTWEAGSQDPAKASNKKPPTKRQADAYHVDVFAGEEHGYYGDTKGVADSQNERPISQQEAFGNTPFQIMTSNMHGCTAVVVVSTRGVWMTHFWESYSNGKDEEGNNLVHRGDPAFNQRVLMFLRGQTVTNPVPNGYKDYVKPTGPGINPNLFNNRDTDQTEVFIYTPVKYGTRKQDMNKVSNLKYLERYGPNGEVRDTIADILGDSRPRITMVPYMPLNTNIPAEAAQMGTNARGSILFQYDPNADGNGRRRWRLLIEDKFYYNKGDLPAPSVDLEVPR
ncbi:hypothetical protein QBC40DRAFT_318421 [Triangularia verruculosa]|uniref:Uncharacterized protein n=1 Tax=Triangularia verruculosa TaxID=2587418 RepID=A0AAN7AR83_9PEZI|nr:hypothetical protein QBC40DRAFT_318421 [Triangularia verruculosa]